MKSLFYSIALALAIPLSSQAADYYFLIDPACVDKLEYQTQGPSGTIRELVYVFKAGNKRIILEVGQSGSQRINQPTGNVITCTSALAQTMTLAQMQSNRIFLTRAISTTNAGYTTSYEAFQVVSMGILQADNFNINLDHWKYSFNFRTSGSQVGSAVPSNQSSSRITYQGVERNGCANTYVFRQSFNFDPQAYIDLKIIPEIGIIGEFPGTPGASAHTLVAVNDQPLSSVLNTLCSNSFNTSPNTRGGTGAFTSQPSFPNPSTNSNNYTPSPAPAPTTRGASSGGAGSSHQVSRGETLWAIAQKYNISVEDLRRWNNINGNAIRSGQNLVVSEGGGGASNFGGGFNQTRGGSGAFGAPTSPSPAPYNQTRGGSGSFGAPSSQSAYNQTRGGNDFLNSSYNNSNFNNPVNANRDPGWVQPPPVPQNIQQASRNDWRNTNGYHRVERGETVASIAMQYGYTEERFRDMNGLAPNTMVQENQVLKTIDQTNRGGAGVYGTSTANPTAYSYDNSSYNLNGTNTGSSNSSYDYNNLYNTNASGDIAFEPYQGEYSPIFGDQPAVAPTNTTESLPWYQSNTQDSYSAWDGSSYDPTYTPPPPANNTGTQTYNQTQPQPTNSNPYMDSQQGGNTPASYDQPASVYTPPGGATTPPPPQSGSTLPQSSGDTGGASSGAPAAGGGSTTLPTFNPSSAPSRGNSSGAFYSTPQPVNPNPNTRGGSSGQFSSTPAGSSIGTTTLSYPGGNDNSAATQNIVGVHTVQPGETVRSISQRYGISVQKLETLNNLVPGSALKPYQKLYIQ